MSRVLFGILIAALFLASTFFNSTSAVAQVTAKIEVTPPNLPSSAVVDQSVTIGGYASVVIANNSDKLAIVSYVLSIRDSRGKVDLEKKSSVCIVDPYTSKSFRVSGPTEATYNSPGTITVTCAAEVSFDGVKKKDSKSGSFKVAPE